MCKCEIGTLRQCSYNIWQVKSMINIAVVDDEPIFIDALINKISDCCNLLGIECIIDKYSNGYSVLENYKKYHLIFLDIEMPSIDGIATAKRINDLKGTAEIPFIIFVTSHDELVFDALKSFPYSFIRKNMIDIDLSECVSRINSYFKQIHQTIILHTERKDIPIIIDEIIYLEKIKNYVIYHTYNQDYKVRSDMNTEFKRISSYSFVRPHIGFAVNNKAIHYIAVDCVLLKNDITIPMNKKYREEIKKKYFKWLGDRNA